MPNPPQAALFAREFSGTCCTSPSPRAVQKVLFAVLAPTARLLGYKGSYPEYLKREPSEMLEVEPWAIP